MGRLGLLVTEGNWVYTDYDWSWACDADWEWTTDHYGRSYFNRSKGWIWIPGEEWTPAWVVWRSGGGYVGWAPLPPKPDVFGEGIDPLIDPFAYSSIDERRLMGAWVYCNSDTAARPISPRNGKRPKGKEDH
jgi:hypothetical protein